MSPILQGYEWASGFNNAASLKPVEIDLPTYQGKHFYVHSQGSWDEGLVNTRGDKLVTIRGWQRFVWTADVMSDEQYNYIQSTYTAGGTGLAARMTVRTLKRDGTFGNFSAVLYLPKKNDLQRIHSAFRDVPLAFTVEAAL